MMEEPKYRALVVEDDPKVRQLTMRALAREDFRCDGAPDGQVATDFLENTDYDVVVLDLCLPIKNGHQLATEILARRHRPVVVVMTAIVEPRLENDLVRRGVDAIVHKPLIFKDFAAKIAAIVQNRHQPDKNQRHLDYYVSSAPHQKVSAASVDDGYQQPLSIESGATMTAEMTLAEMGEMDQEQGTPANIFHFIEQQGHSEEHTHETIKARSGSIDQPTKGGASEVTVMESMQVPPAQTHTKQALHGVDRPLSSQDIISLLEYARETTQPEPYLPPAPVVPGSNGESKQQTPDTTSNAVPSGVEAAQQATNVWHWAPRAHPRHLSSVAIFAVVVGLTLLFQLLMHLSYERQQERAMLAIERLGAKVSQTPQGGIAVDLQDGEVTQLLLLLKDVRDLQLLEMQHSNVTDAQLASLPPLQKLRQLGLDDTSVSDAGIDNLRGLESLQELRLRNTAVSSSKISELVRRYPALKILSNQSMVDSSFPR